MPVSRVYVISGSPDDVWERVSAHAAGDKVPWKVECKAYSSTVRAPASASSGAGAPAGGAVTLVGFSDSPAVVYAQAGGRSGEVLRCGSQMEAVLELLGGRYRIMRTVQLSGFKVGLGDVELRVGQVPASVRRAEGSGVTLAEVRYLPCAYEATCAPVLLALADAVLPSGWAAATDLPDAVAEEPAVAADAAPSDEPEFDDRALVRQYLAVLRDKKAL